VEEMILIGGIGNTGGEFKSILSKDFKQCFYEYFY
jgi:hypothetical protein